MTTRACPYGYVDCRECLRCHKPECQCQCDPWPLCDYSDLFDDFSDDLRWGRS